MHAIMYVGHYLVLMTMLICAMISKRFSYIVTYNDDDHNNNVPR